MLDVDICYNGMSCSHQPNAWWLSRNNNIRRCVDEKWCNEVWRRTRLLTLYRNGVCVHPHYVLLPGETLVDSLVGGSDLRYREKHAVLLELEVRRRNDVFSCREAKLKDTVLFYNFSHLVCRHFYPKYLCYQWAGRGSGIRWIALGLKPRSFCQNHSIILDPK